MAARMDRSGSWTRATTSASAQGTAADRARMAVPSAASVLVSGAMPP